VICDCGASGGSATASSRPPTTWSGVYSRKQWCGAADRPA
jgi:hypothetical protein